MNMAVEPEKLTAKDFASDQEVRWCPGCGDYAILKTIQKVMPQLGVPKEKIVFVSGIGCSSRFPYYMETYGFHTIHGRAPAIATGVKLANPELDVWVITGDGDGLSIGGNHMLHVLRRNVDLQLLLFNNEIYGLTKGQYSPTSAVGTRSPSTPDGSVDLPCSPCRVAFGAGARFVARAVDIDNKLLPEVLLRAQAHKGASFVEILQNCPVYNDGFFDHIRDKKQAPASLLVMEHGKPLLFGREREQGLRLDPVRMALEVVRPGEGGVTLDDVLVHDETNRMLGQLLADLKGPDLPTPVGVFYREAAPSYVNDVYRQRLQVRERRDQADLNSVLRSGNTWSIR